MSAGAHLPEAIFDRAAWDADQERPQREHFFRNDYRGQTPPWVVLSNVDAAQG